MRTLYQNAAVVTMAPEIGTTDAMLVEDQRLVAVGEEARQRAGGAELVDLEGRTVVPGLIDAHAHLETDAISNWRWVDVRGVSEDELLRRLAQRAAEVPQGTWIVGQATFSQDRNLPLRPALDAVLPNHPVLIRASMHALTANTRALERAGLLDQRFAPPGTVIDRETDGTPTGRLLEAYHLFPVDPPALRDLIPIVETAVRERFNRYGVTTVYEVPMSRAGMRAFQTLDATDRLTARVALFPAVAPGLQPLVDDIEQIAALGLASGFGNERLWFGGLKYFLDSIYDYSFDPGRDITRPSRWGAVTHQYQEVVRAFSISFDAGLQLWFHALGKGAQQMVIDAALEAQQVFGGDPGTRNRIEHIFNDHPGSEHMFQGLLEANLIPVPNPAFVHIYDDETGSFPYRTLLDRGFQPPGNSDNSGTQPFANNPWFGIGKLRTRKNRDGIVIAPDEQISVYDALRTYTEFAAFAGHREKTLGALRPGQMADFAVLSDDPFSVPDDDLEQITSVLTVMDGRMVWSA